jgi:hypothetical protein
MPLGLKLSIVACTLGFCAVVLSFTGHAIGLLFAGTSVIVSIVSFVSLFRTAHSNRRKQ